MQIEPHPPHHARIEDDGFDALRAGLVAAGIEVVDASAFASTLRAHLDSYESLANGVGEWLLTPMPPLIPNDGAQDDWQTGS